MVASGSRWYHGSIAAEVIVTAGDHEGRTVVVFEYIVWYGDQEIRIAQTMLLSDWFRTMKGPP